MTLSGRFGVTGGSVTGKEHRRLERDGQDGWALVAGDEVMAAIVTDGCGSGRSSEIGARVGAAWIAALVEQRFRGCGGEARARAAAAEVAGELLLRLEVLARSLDPAGDLTPARIEGALLFTFLAAVVTPSVAIVFGIGDGALVVDGAVSVLDPGPRNAPPYAAYGLLGKRIDPAIHFVGDTRSVEVVAVATDGLANEPSLADLTELTALTADLRYLQNPSLLRKRLVVLSDHGRFSDDATLAVIRRRAS